MEATGRRFTGHKWPSPAIAPILQASVMLFFCMMLSPLKGVPVGESVSANNLNDSILDPISVRSHNIALLKLTKVGGSTASGIVRRIGDHYNVHGVFTGRPHREPAIYAQHGCFDALNNSTLTKWKQPIFLLTVIREPTERKLSKFYHFQVRNNNKTASVENKLNFLKTFKQSDQFDCLKNPQVRGEFEQQQSRAWSESASESVSEPASLEQLIEPILRTYDFIGITNRFDESMVLLAAKLQLSICDILYLRAKDSSHAAPPRAVDMAELAPEHQGTIPGQKVAPQEDHEAAAQLGVHVPLSSEPSEVRAFVESEEFQRGVALDLLLYRRAGAMLDAAIEALGPQSFQAALASYSAALTLAQARCGHGEAKKYCYSLDAGCGYKCLDQMCGAADLRAWLNPVYPFSPRPSSLADIWRRQQQEAAGVAPSVESQRSMLQGDVVGAVHAAGGRTGPRSLDSFMAQAPGAQTFPHPTNSSNLVLIKVPKVGGSTVSGVLRRVGHHHGLAGVYVNSLPNEPGVQAKHGSLVHAWRNYLARLTYPTFLMTFIREPVSHKMSKYYHFYVRNKNESTASDSKISFLRGNAYSDQIRYISPEGSAKGAIQTLSEKAEQQAADKVAERQQGVGETLHSEYEEQVQLALRPYELVGITDRFDESMVLLAAKLQLSICDILYLRAKNSNHARYAHSSSFSSSASTSSTSSTSSNGSTDASDAPLVGVHIPLSSEPSEVRAFVESEEFQRGLVLDLLLYRRAGAMLDAAIEALGPQSFHAALASYSAALTLAQAQCETSEAKKHCYNLDAGCGYKCLDQMCAAAETASVTATAGSGVSGASDTSKPHQQKQQQEKSSSWLYRYPFDGSADTDVPVRGPQDWAAYTRQSHGGGQGGQGAGNSATPHVQVG